MDLLGAILKDPLLNYSVFYKVLEEDRVLFKTNKKGILSVSVVVIGFPCPWLGAFFNNKVFLCIPL